MTASQSKYERLVKAFTDSIGVTAMIAPCMQPTDTCSVMGYYIGNPYNDSTLLRIQTPIVYGRDEYDVWRQMFMSILKSFDKTEDELEVLADISEQIC